MVVRLAGWSETRGNTDNGLDSSLTPLTIESGGEDPETLIIVLHH